MKRAAIVITLALAVGLISCTGSDRSRSDPMITSAIKKEFDGQHLPTSIGVVTDKGVVTLGGAVPDTATKARAETIAKNVDGVQYVVNNLRTTMAGDAPALPPALAPHPPSGIEPENAPPGATNLPPQVPPGASSLR